MRVLINAASANRHGAVTYLTNVLSELPALAESDHFSVIAPSETVAKMRAVLDDPVYSTMPYLHPPNQNLRRIVFDQLRVPSLARTERSDLLFSANGFGSFRSSCPQLLLVRNAIYFCPRFEAKYRELGLSLRATMLRRYWSFASIRTADFVMFPTHAMRDLVASTVELKDERTRVIHYGFNRSAFFREGAKVPALVGELRGLKESGHQILLAMSDYAVHRNVETVVRALPALLEAGHRVKLVMTMNRETAAEPEEFDKLIGRIRELGLQDVVLTRDAVSYEQVHHVYAQADVFVYPSLTESFGHPMVEAMACGLAIVASDVPVNREVLGDAATFFEISNPASCAREIERLLVEPQRSEQLRGRALERSNEFSWSRYTRELLDVFRNLDS